MLKNNGGIPESVTVGGEEYKIEVRENVLFKGSTAWGLLDRRLHLISLSRGLCDVELKKTLFHEISHIISHEGHLDLGEDQCDRLGKAMIMFILENPELILALLGIPEEEEQDMVYQIETSNSGE